MTEVVKYKNGLYILQNYFSYLNLLLRIELKINLSVLFFKCYKQENLTHYFLKYIYTNCNTVSL